METRTSTINFAVLTVAILTMLAARGASGTVFEGPGTPRIIPEQNLSLISSISVPESESVTSMSQVEIEIEIQHPRIFELEIYLTYQLSDGFARISELLKFERPTDEMPIRSGQDMHAIFSSDATRTIDLSTPDFFGQRFREQDGDSLAGLKTLSSHATWTLIILDRHIGENTGTLKSWSLTIEGTGTPDSSGDDGDSGSEDDVTVPAVAGLSQSAAESFIVNAELLLGTVTEAFSDTVEAGTVISSQPSAGTMVAVGTTVNLTVSRGMDVVAVPALRGLSESGAESALTNAGLQIGEVFEDFTADVDTGNVIESDPIGGTLVARGSTVDLTISRGIEQVTVPSVAGFSQAGAEGALTNAGLTLGTVTEVFSETAAGLVVGQVPASGTMVDSGSAVILTISKGPESSTVASGTGCPQSTSEAIEVVKRSVGDFFILGLSMVTLLGLGACRKG